MLVLLRLSIGWHFYSEGVDKYSTNGWSAAPFFANAKGPFAEHYRQIVWDSDGSIRLDRDRMMLEWATLRDQAATHFGFDDEQKRRAQANYAKAVEQYDWVMSENAADIEEYNLGRDRLSQLEQDPVRDGVDSLGGQRDTIRREWAGKGASALNQIDTIWENYAIVQTAIATKEQLASQPPFRLVKPRSARIDTSLIDEFVPYFDMAIGLCLLLGLFTPIAALAAAGFLGSVFLSQYPPTAGPGSTYYQLIECMACLVLAGTGAGRFAGMDYFLHLIVRKFSGVSNENS